MSQITVVIPVKNEAFNLSRCVPLALKLGPVLVVDSGSTDNSSELALEMGAEVLQFRWDGKFPKKRNWTLRNYRFQTEWVLFLDADEFVSDAFLQEVKVGIQKNDKVGFWLNFENHFMGQKLLGGDPFKKLALFRVGAGEYEKIEENNWSHLDMEVHEHPILDGPIGEIKAPIEHNDFRGLKHYIAKHNEYSSWEAARYLRLMNVPSKATRPDEKRIGPNSAEWEGLTDRQKKKYRNIERWWFAPSYFILNYIFRKGFLDGGIGLHFSLMKFFYFYQIRLKIIEQRR